MTQPIHPDAEQVAVAWAKTLALPVGQGVATVVPEFTAWPVAGGSTSRAFLQILATGGGVVRDTPLRSSVLSFDSWAGKSGSDRPPLALASQILSAVLHETFYGTFPRQLTVGARTVTVHSAWPVTEHARRIPDQDTSRAHYSIDIQIMWSEEGS